MKLHHLALRCNDIEASAQFYQTVLALPVLRRQGHYSIWLKTEDVVIMLEQRSADEPLIQPNSKELLTFAAESMTVHEMQQFLHDLHIEVEAQTEYTCYFRDPDGRRVAISNYPFEPHYAAAPGGDA